MGVINKKNNGDKKSHTPSHHQKKNDDEILNDKSAGMEKNTKVKDTEGPRTQEVVLSAGAILSLTEGSERQSDYHIEISTNNDPKKSSKEEKTMGEMRKLDPKRKEEMTVDEMSKLESFSSTSTTTSTEAVTECLPTDKWMQTEVKEEVNVDDVLIHHLVPEAPHSSTPSGTKSDSNGHPGAFAVAGINAVSNSNDNVNCDDFMLGMLEEGNGSQDTSSTHSLTASEELRLFKATLVEPDTDNVVKAEPAPTGFRAIMADKKAKFGVVFLVCLILAIVIPVMLLTTSSPPTTPIDGVVVNITLIEACGSDALKQADYRGTVAITESGKTCQRWDSQYPHGHDFDTFHQNKDGLDENYCRNPDGDARAYVQ